MPVVQQSGRYRPLEVMRNSRQFGETEMGDWGGDRRPS